MNDILGLLTQERPVGTDSNNKIIEMIEGRLAEMGYTVKSVPFDCNVWEQGKSTIRIGSKEFCIEPSPFSEPFTGSSSLCIAKTMKDLQEVDCQGAILFLTGEVAQVPLSPKNYPFYYPDEHKNIITLLEQKQPTAIIAVTGQSTLNGKNPFPLFEDGNFLIPSANITQAIFEGIEVLLNGGTKTAELTINSCKKASHSRQIVASKKSGKSKGKIILSAHMDTKYETLGALDNATGVAVLLEAAANMDASVYDIDVVPFNSEEYYGANGELEYLKMLGDEKVILMINIDSPCHKNSETAMSFHNFNDAMQAMANSIMLSSTKVVKGNEWYAGDHAPFVFRGTPCLVVTSSDFFNGALEHTHTPKDTLDTVDAEMVKCSAKYLVDVVAEISSRERKRTRQFDR